MKQNVMPDMAMWSPMLKEFEGYRQHAYADSGGVWTVGYGSTYNHIEKRKVKVGDSVTEFQALQFVSIDAASLIFEANRYIKNYLNPEQSTAICDYIYNRGIGNFLKTQLDELINVNPNDPRILAEIKGTGLRDRLGNFWKGLQRRRDFEASMYWRGITKNIPHA